MTLKNTYYLLTHASSISVLVPVLVSLVCYKSFNRQLKALFLYLLLCLANSITCLILADKNLNTSLLFDFFTLLESLIIIYMYGKEFNVSPKRIFSGQLIILLLSALNYLFPTVHHNFASATIAAFISCLAIAFFYRTFIELKVPVLTDYYFFWINSAFLFYFGTTFLLVLFGDFIRSCEEGIAILLWMIQLTANIICNLIIAFGIWRIKKI